jgi:hypothetical protein
VFSGIKTRWEIYASHNNFGTFIHFYLITSKTVRLAGSVLAKRLLNSPPQVVIETFFFFIKV